MTYLDLSKKVDEAVQTKDLEAVIKFIKSLNTKDDKKIKSELKKKFKKLTSDDIDLAISLV